MTHIVKESNPNPARLKALGVDDWPVWEKGVSKFPWEYIEDETSYILEGRAIIHPEGGEAVEIRKGDLVTFPSELECTWEILEPLKKRYRIG
jgi:hypothetical protein